MREAAGRWPWRWSRGDQPRTSNPQDVELDELLGQAAGKRQGRGVLKRSGKAAGRQAKGERARVGPALPFDLRVGPRQLECAYGSGVSGSVVSGSLPSQGL